jgi:DNA-binding helix-hairpin-helix protein with protein kinase domain
MLWAVSATAAFWISKWALSIANANKVNAIALNYRAAKTRWDGLQTRWRAESDASAFDQTLQIYARLHQEHGRIAGPIKQAAQQRAQQHAAAMQRWTSAIVRRAAEARRNQKVTVSLSDAELVAARDAQLADHLDRFSIDRAGIPDIGTSRSAKLASFGIETAGDVTQHKVQLVPGFGPAFTKRLLDWRKMVESRFQFDEHAAHRDIESGRVRASVPPMAPAAITIDDTSKRRLRQIESELSVGVARLQQVAASIRARHESLLAEARLLAEALAQGEADARAARVIK